MCNRNSCLIGGYQNQTEIPYSNSYIVWNCGCIEILPNPPYEMSSMAHKVEINERTKKIVITECYGKSVNYVVLYDSLDDLHAKECYSCGISLNYIINARH